MSASTPQDVYALLGRKVQELEETQAALAFRHKELEVAMAEIDSLRKALRVSAQEVLDVTEHRSQLVRELAEANRLLALPILPISVKLIMPAAWLTEEAETCFSRSYNGEGSYYCPHCHTNRGAVWENETWRPTKRQALCAQTCAHHYTEESLQGIV
jgi:hypothetical protein